MEEGLQHSSLPDSRKPAHYQRSGMSPRYPDNPCSYKRGHMELTVVQNGEEEIAIKDGAITDRSLFN